jgi:hypothetical protein
VPGGLELQLEKRQMCNVEIDRGNACRISREVRHDVAAAGGDRNDVVIGLDVHGGHVYSRIFQICG